MRAIAVTSPDAIPAILEHLRIWQTFTGWDSKRIYTIVEIKPYEVQRYKGPIRGCPAIWVSSPRPRSSAGGDAVKTFILFPRLIQAAMQFILDPACRGAYQVVCPPNFQIHLNQGPADCREYPGYFSNAGLHLSLAKTLLEASASWTA